MTISIESVATYYPESKRSIQQLAQRANKSLEWAKSTGITELHVSKPGTAVTEAASKAVIKSLRNVKVESKEVDQLVFISEGISDYLYMDSSKHLLRKIGGRTDGSIHTNDFFRGGNGTIGFIKLIGNQVLTNPAINISVMCSSLIWENHSNKRVLGNTFLGDGAGSIVLKNNLDYNQVLSVAVMSMSQYNMVTGFKYGGTKFDFTKKVVRGGEFVFDIIRSSHLKGVLDSVVQLGIKVAQEALFKAKISINQIGYIGVSGFREDYNEKILHGVGVSSDVKKICSLSIKGYLGSVGVMEVLDIFFNDEEIKRNSTMLIIAVGIDINVEAMVVRK